MYRPNNTLSMAFRRGLCFHSFTYLLNKSNMSGKKILRVWRGWNQFSNWGGGKIQTLKAATLTNSNLPECLWDWGLNESVNWISLILQRRYFSNLGIHSLSGIRLIMHCFVIVLNLSLVGFIRKQRGQY